jgi:stearoyl-CoA desaturase (Delta-9 desaturase)
MTTIAMQNQRTYRFGTVIPFLLLHLAAISVFYIRFRWSLLGWMLMTYGVRMFAITAGYHRYFSHRTYKLGRVSQLIIAFLAETSGQKGVLWWAAHHRVHHRTADHAGDVHSPGLSGIWWAHVGWVISGQHDEYDPRLIQDFGKYAELRWLDRHYLVPPVALGVAILIIGGLDAFVWGFLVSTVVLFHATFAINSLAHIWGSRRFATPDDSRNNFILALLTFGEGWHNNHHQFMYSCRQGFRWWEIDLTYYGVRLLGWLGIAREIRGVRNRGLEDGSVA